MHRATTELVICAFVLLPVRTCEPGLMALLAIVACAAAVPAFHVETAGEADVLVSKICHDVRKLGVSNASNTVGRAAGNVWNDVRSDCRGGLPR